MSLDRQARQIAILLQPDMLAISRFVVVGPTRPLLGSGSASRVVPAVENSAFAYQMFPLFGSPGRSAVDIGRSPGEAGR